MLAQLSRTHARPLVVGAAMLGATFVLSSCGIAQQLAGQEPGGDPPEPPETPETTQEETEEPEEETEEPEPEPEETSEPDNVDIWEVREGDCVNHESMDEGPTSEMPVVPCSEPHDGEVFAIEELDGDRDFPGESEIQQEANELCTGDVFEDFVGTHWGASQYWTIEWWPTEEGWDLDDREVICVIYDRGGQTTGSLEGAED